MPPILQQPFAAVYIAIILVRQKMFCSIGPCSLPVFSVVVETNADDDDVDSDVSVTVSTDNDARGFTSVVKNVFGDDL